MSGIIGAIIGFAISSHFGLGIIATGIVVFTLWALAGSKD